MSNLLAALDAAAELGNAATKRPWHPGVGAVAVDVDRVCGFQEGIVMDRGVTDANRKYIAASANLDLASIAKALRDKDAETAALRESLAAAEKVLDRLPKTADGVPITPGMMVFHGTDSFDYGEDWKGWEVLHVGMEYKPKKQRRQWVFLSDGFGECCADVLYSTRAAALAARDSGKASGGGAEDGNV